MAESVKRTECVKVCMEERMLLDLNRQAIREDRKLADYLYLCLKRYAYGNLARDTDSMEVPNRDSDAL